MSVQSQQPESVDGLAVGLLVIIALLLAGCATALWRIVPLMPAAERETNRPPPASPAILSGGVFDDLFLHDLMLGLIDLQKSSDPTLRLTAAQARTLQALVPQIRARLKVQDWSASPVDASVRQALRDPQKKEIRRLRGVKNYLPPPNGGSLADRFEETLRETAP